MKFNIGVFDLEAKTYTKKVSFNKAVLWKDKQISLNRAVTVQFKKFGTETVIFIDEVKKERWTASVEKLRECATLKKEGQEPQFYFPITAFKQEKY